MQEDDPNPEWSGYPAETFSSPEAEIGAEDEAIHELLEYDSNAAYLRAVANLECARRTGKDRLTMRCAFTLGRCANGYSPYPKVTEAIEAYRLAAETASAVGNLPGYATTLTNLGTEYFELQTENRRESLQKAIDCYEKAARIYADLDLSAEYAMTQINLGNAYSDLPEEDRAGNLQTAISFFEKGLEVYTGEAFPEEYAVAMMNLANAYCDLPTGDYAENLYKAIGYYESALKVCTEDELPQHYAMIQNGLGTAYSDLPTGDREGNLLRSLRYFDNALRHFEKEEFPLQYAMIKDNLGTVYSSLPAGDRAQNLSKAVSCHQEALEVYTEKDYPIDYAVTHNNLGTVYFSLPTGHRGKNLMTAIDCYQKALRIHTEEDFPFEYAKLQTNLGNAFSDLPTGSHDENLRKAIAHHQNALRVYTEEKFPQEYARTWNNLGNAYSMLFTGDLGENLTRAIACYEKALKIRKEKAFPLDHAATRHNLGIAWLDLPTGDRGENLRIAIECFRNASRVRKAKGSLHEYAETLISLGSATHELPTGDRGRNIKKAIGFYKKALRIFTKKDFPLDFALAMNNLGNSWSDLPSGDREKNLKNAIACHVKALAVYSKESYPQSYAMAQNNLGIAYSTWPAENREENQKKAIACYVNALSTRPVEQFPQDRAITLDNLAQSYDDYAVHDPRMAHAACAEAIDILEKHVREVSCAGTRRAVAEAHAGMYHRMVSLCVRLGKPAEALSYAERGKSRTMVEMLHSARLQPSQHVPEEVRKPFLAVRKKVEELYNRRQAGETATPRDFHLEEDKRGRIFFHSIAVAESSPREDIWPLLEEVEAAYERLLKEIRRLDPEFAASERVQPLFPADMSALIPERTALVECFTGYDGTYVFVLDGETDIADTYLHLDKLTEAELFDDLVSRSWLKPYHALLKQPTKENEQAWLHAIESTPRLLAEKLWYAKDERGSSLAGLLEQSGAERIVLLPHTGLHLLPLHLMPLSKESPEPRLMDRYEVCYAPSLSMLRFVLNRASHPPERLLAVANPDRSLDFAGTEVRSISKHFPEAEVLWYEAASKQAIFARAERADIVHFSCHGNFKDEDPLDSHLILAGENLTLREIFANLRLTRAGTVLLAACETGMVKLEPGDEYIGLPSGFLHAGAATVISSLWPVDDFSSSLLLERWYENMRAKNMGRAAALREAQHWLKDMKVKDARNALDMLIAGAQGHTPSEQRRRLSFKLKLRELRGKSDNHRPFAHPYYWGGLVCTGNWN